MEFINVKLSDIGEVVGGSTPSTKNPDNYDGNIAWITPKDLAGYNKVYISRGERNITKAGFKSCSTKMLPKNSVLFSSRAPIGYVAISENDLCTNQGFKSIIPNEKVDYKFLYYLLKHNKDYIASKGSGSTFKEVSGSVMKGIELSIPKDINDQRRISKVLFDIDKKIELNNEINNNLYDMLKRLYKELYLNNPSYNTWESMTLNDVTCKFATGLNPRKNFVLGQGNNYYVTIKNMPNNQVILDDKCDKVDDEALIKINKRSDLKVGDLLFSGIGTIGRTYLIKSKPTNWNISESVFTIRPNDKISSEFLYLLLLDSDMQNYAVSKASGSVQKGIRMADLKLYKLKVPGKEWMDTFTNTISPLIDKIYLNYEMNEKLCRLRDTLLPKLMNGEIDLDNIEI